jgi:MFS family permease
MNGNLWRLALAQGVFLTNNVTFIGINGLVGLQLAPYGWMATLPIMGYVVGSALCTGLVARTQRRWGRQRSFQLGLVVAVLSALMAALATVWHSFGLLLLATVVAGYYSANAQLYRFAAAEMAAPDKKEKAISLVLTGGLIGAVFGPNMAAITREWLATPFTGVYLALALVGVFGLAVMHTITFAEAPAKVPGEAAARPLSVIVRQPVFVVAAMAGALGYGVMNLLMAATPLAMQVCRLPFDDIALVLEWHVIGMFAPGLFTGNLIKRFGVFRIMGAGVLLNMACVAIALSGVELSQFVVSLFLLGVGWNFLFTGSTTLSLQAYAPQERDQAQAALNFTVFAVMALTSFGAGALVTTQGWQWINLASLLPLAMVAAGLWWLAKRPAAPASAA